MDQTLERLKQFLIKQHRYQEMRVMPRGYPKIEVLFSSLLKPDEIRKWEVTPKKIVVKWNLPYLTEHIDEAMNYIHSTSHHNELQRLIETETRETLARIRSFHRK